MSILARLTDLPDGHPDQLHDFDKRYLSTYMQQNNALNKRILFYLGRDKYNLHFNSQLEETIIIPGKEENFDVSPFLPEVGYYNHDGSPIYMIKQPARQWRRSFCSGIYKARGRLLDSRYAWAQVAESVFHSKYAHLDEITNPLFANVAINNKFAVYPKIQGYPSLLYKQYVVGILNFNDHTIHVTQPALKQELQDLIKYYGVTKWKLNPIPAE